MSHQQNLAACPQSVSEKRLSDSDLRAISLPARLAVKRRRSRGDPTSAVEAEELRDQIGPSAAVRLLRTLLVLASLAGIAWSAWTVVAIERRQALERPWAR